MKEENAALQTKLSVLSSQLSDIEDKTRSQASTHITVEKNLRSQVAELETQILTLSDQLKVCFLCHLQKLCH